MLVRTLIVVPTHNEEENIAEILQPVAAGRDVRAVGEDVAAGAPLLPRGHRVRPFDIGALLGGAIVTERIFNIQGVGGFLFRSIGARDGVAVVGTVTALVVVYLFCNLLVDLLYGVLDPRISHD